MKLQYTYTDSLAGTQALTVDKLSAAIKHIEDFGWHGDSQGYVLQNGKPILEYLSLEDKLQWYIPQ